MELNGKNIRLRPLSIQDLPKMVLWNRDAEIQSYVDCTLPDSLNNLERWYRDNVPDRHYQIFAIETTDGLLIGDLELDHICWSRREAELRIRIGEKNFWGRGFGSEALKLILGHMFSEKKFVRIYLRVYTFNHRAINCYLKNGFKSIGILRRGVREWKDIILMETNGIKYRKALENKMAG